MGLIRDMKDVRDLLKGFGTVIYTGDRLADLEMMEEELQELQRAGVLESDIYIKAVSVLNREKKKWDHPQG
ncbi:YqgQ family protein [Kroppenstedtia pulmonis]|uniref:YqgQ family protein n=1 Tax=Kroppenstedtia pulmonis TaxID=1380685 RepID=UPI001FE55F13|nr:YqgQ family protein [Kroppenstedtia pulmonis]